MKRLTIFLSIVLITGMAFGQTTQFKKNIQIYKPAATLFLDNSQHTGEIINWGEGDVLLTHTSNKLAFTGGVIDFSVLPTVAGSALSALYTSGNISISTNSLLMTGSIGATGARVTKGWFTDIETTTLTKTGSVSVGVDTCKNIETSKTVAGIGLLRCTGTCTLKGLANGVTGQILKIVNTTATTLTLKHNGTGTQKFMISGGTDLALTGQYNAVTLIFDGTNWYVTGKGQ